MGIGILLGVSITFNVLFIVIAILYFKIKLASKKNWNLFDINENDLEDYIKDTKETKEEDKTIMSNLKGLF